jgi:predicted GNAT superfamily acetyltransferase
MIQNMSNFEFRVATRSDFPAILTLNRQSEHFLSPLDLPKLTRISKEAAVFQVVTSAECVTGFLLCFLPEADYDNPNFFWFKTHYENFLYIDRIVISEDLRGHHLATRFYNDLAKHAIARGIPRLACEIHLDPPNPVSLRFHQKQGFAEVGQQFIEEEHANDSATLVSLQIKETES